MSADSGETGEVEFLNLEPVDCMIGELSPSLCDQVQRLEATAGTNNTVELCWEVLGGLGSQCHSGCRLGQGLSNITSR